MHGGGASHRRGGRCGARRSPAPGQLARPRPRNGMTCGCAPTPHPPITAPSVRLARAGRGSCSPRWSPPPASHSSSCRGTRRRVCRRFLLARTPVRCRGRQLWPAAAGLRAGARYPPRSPPRSRPRRSSADTPSAIPGAGSAQAPSAFAGECQRAGPGQARGRLSQQTRAALAQVAYEFRSASRCARNPRGRGSGAVRTSPPRRRAPPSPWARTTPAVRSSPKTV